MAHQAIITLRSRTPGIVPAKRILKLNPDRVSVPIGRASKSVSKGLLSAEDNAWFDNPVMSRDHAELILDLETMSIMIKDIQSMHGTQVNNVRLTPDTFGSIKNGDIVAFGAEVRRGPETFPPCCFHIEYEFVPWTRGFQFPDSSDIEEDQDQSEEEEGEEEEDICEDIQEDDMTPVESPVPKISIPVDAIDLTNDEFDSSEKPTGAKTSTTGEAVVDAQSQDIYFVEDTNIRSGGHVENPIFLEDADSDEKDSDEEEVENEQRDYEDSEDQSDEDSDKENEEGNEGHTDGAVEESIYDWEGSDIMPTESQQGATKNSNMQKEAVPHMFYDNKDIPVSSMRTTVERLPDAQAITDIETQKSNCMLDVSWDTGYSENIDDDMSSQQDNIEETQNCVPKIGEKTNTEEGFTDYSRVGVMTDLLSQENTSNRQPSPSDAALAKSMTKSSPVSLAECVPDARTINPVQLHPLPEQEWNQPMSQSLGDKTGKHDFFQAREVNRTRLSDDDGRYPEYGSVGDGIARAKFNQLGHPYNPRPVAAPVSLLSNGQPSLYFQAQRYQQQMNQQQHAQQHMIHNNQMAQQAQQLVQQRMAQQLAQKYIIQHQISEHQRLSNQMMNTQQFIAANNSTGPTRTPSCGPTHVTFPTPEEKPEPPKHTTVRNASPELDMTSAVMFNHSKASTADQNSATKQSRSAVRIDDLVEPSVAQPTTKSLKRKAFEISDVLEEEVRVWASKDASIPTEKAAQDELQTPQIVTSPTADVGGKSEQHKTKRLRRLAEAVGYAALGGLAVGAGLFSVLVATAPDFN